MSDLTTEQVRNSLRAGDVVGVEVDVDEDADGLEWYRVVDLVEGGFVGWGPLKGGRRHATLLPYEEVVEYQAREKAGSDYVLGREDAVEVVTVDSEEWRHRLLGAPADAEEISAEEIVAELEAMEDAEGGDEA